MSFYTHGIEAYPNGCFAIKIEKHEPTVDYILYPVVMPNVLPYNIRMENVDDAIAKLNMITENIEKVDLELNYQLTPEKVLPLSLMSLNNTNVLLNITGHSNNLYCDHIGSSVNELIMTDLTVCQKDLIPPDLERLRLTHIKFNVQSITITEIEDVEYDVSSLIELQRINSLQAHYKNLRITNVHYIIFTDDGFIFGSEQGIKSQVLRKNIVENIEIFSTCSINLDLKDPVDQRLIKGMKIFISSCDENSDAYISIGNGWDKISNVADIQIFADRNANVVVATPIYPVPAMNVNKQYSTMFNPLSNNLLISDKAPISQDLLMEMPSDFQTHYIVNGNNIVVTKSTMIKCDFNATIRLNSLNVRDGSNASLYNFNVNNQIKAAPGAHTSMYQASMSPSSVIEIHWSKDRWPSIHLDLNSNDEVSSQIKIVLDDSEIDYDEYHLFTYRKEFKIIQGNFECSLIMKNVHFNSSDTYFADSDDLIFKTECSKGVKSSVVSVRGVYVLPISDNSLTTDKQGLQTPSIISIVVAIIIVLCVAIGVTVFFVSRKKFIKMLNEKKTKKQKAKKKSNEISEEEDNVSLGNISEHSNESEEDSYE